MRGSPAPAAVTSYLQSLGLAADRADVVSYANEGPFSTELGETGSALNRREHDSRTCDVYSTGSERRINCDPEASVN